MRLKISSQFEFNNNFCKRKERVRRVEKIFTKRKYEKIHFPIGFDVISDCCWKSSASQQDLFECIQYMLQSAVVRMNPRHQKECDEREGFLDIFGVQQQRGMHAKISYIGLNWSWSAMSRIDISACMIRTHPFNSFQPGSFDWALSCAVSASSHSQRVYVELELTQRHTRCSAAAAVMWIHQSINWNLSCDCTKRITMSSEGIQSFNSLSSRNFSRFFLC